MSYHRFLGPTRAVAGSFGAGLFLPAVGDEAAWELRP